MELEKRMSEFGEFIITAQKDAAQTVVVVRANNFGVAEKSAFIEHEIQSSEIINIERVKK